jgi:hypothetical protein
MAAGFLILLACFWIRDHAPSESIPMPNPNGYHGLVEAGQLISQGNFEQMDQAELEAFVRSNSNALQMARHALRQECRVPLQFTQPWIEAHIKDLSPMKSLAQAFTAEGRLAEQQLNPTSAVRSHLDTLNLGVELARGGLMIDGLVALAIEAIGTKNLQAIIQDLDAKTCREAAASLEALDARRTSLQDVLMQERRWASRTYPDLKYKLASLMMAKSTRKSQQQFEQKHKELVSKTRRLFMDLAARAYELEKNTPLENPSTLVPDYLKAIPQDPLTGTTMKRR